MAETENCEGDDDLEKEDGGAGVPVFGFTGETPVPPMLPVPHMIELSSEARHVGSSFSNSAWSSSYSKSLSSRSSGSGRRGFVVQAFDRFNAYSAQASVERHQQAPASFVAQGPFEARAQAVRFEIEREGCVQIGDVDRLVVVIVLELDQLVLDVHRRRAFGQRQDRLDPDVLEQDVDVGPGFAESEVLVRREYHFALAFEVDAAVLVKHQAVTAGFVHGLRAAHLDERVHPPSGFVEFLGDFGVPEVGQGDRRHDAQHRDDQQNFQERKCAAFHALLRAASTAVKRGLNESGRAPTRRKTHGAKRCVGISATGGLGGEPENHTGGTPVPPWMSVPPRGPVPPGKKPRSFPSW